jgi:signal peptidase I
VIRALGELLSTVVPAILIALFLNVFVVQARTVDGPSMQPNLYRGHRVITEKVTYRFLHGPRRGDVVVIHRPGEELPFIKRAIGLPGETVEITDGRVHIDGRPLEEPWSTRVGSRDYPGTYVPPLHVFVLGDNRPSSHDSRSFGPVPLEQIKGRALFVYWPPDQMGSLRKALNRKAGAPVTAVVAPVPRAL